MSMAIPRIVSLFDCASILRNISWLFLTLLIALKGSGFTEIDLGGIGRMDSNSVYQKSQLYHSCGVTHVHFSPFPRCNGTLIMHLLGLRVGRLLSPPTNISQSSCGGGGGSGSARCFGGSETARSEPEHWRDNKHTDGTPWWWCILV